MKKLIFLLLMTVTMIGVAQNSPDAIVERFFDNYQKKGAVTALDELYAGTGMLENFPDDVAYQKNQLSNLNEVLGNYNGHELLIRKQLGSCYMAYIFLVKYDRQPTQFLFEFYMPKDEWNVYGFAYGFKMTDEFVDHLKTEILE